MAVHWSWKDLLGQLTIKQDGKTFKVSLYTGGNCIAAILYEFKDEETKKPMYRFISFLDDEKHVKNIIKEEGKLFYYYEDVRKIRLNFYYKSAQKLATYLCKDYKVECYYKEPKKSKKSK